MLYGASIAYAQESHFDAEMAKEFGADMYGMKTYVFVILQTGERSIDDKNLRDSLFAGHLQNIRKLANEDKLVLAGPLFANEKQYRGIFILNTDSLEEAEEWLQSDPVIREKLLDAQCFKWYGSAALHTYLEVHRMIEQTQP